MRSRRNASSIAAATVAVAALSSGSSDAALDSSGYARGVLSVRPPLAPPRKPAPPAPVGLSSLGLGDARDGVLYVPPSYRADRPMPLVVVLHGAGGTGPGTLGILERLADERGFIIVAPDSRDRRTWDSIVGDFGPDVAFLDRALARVFARYAVDKDHVAISGFSDGASYALSLGLTNGDLFHAVLAFSPGFAAHAEVHGRPRVFVSHGSKDAVLNVDRCSRALVPRLARAGYRVRYREFDGPHTVPPAIAREAIEDWLEHERR